GGTERFPGSGSSQNHLKLLGIGVHNHLFETNGPLLPGATFDGIGTPLHAWQTLLLPHIEQDDLYRQIHLDLPWDHPMNVDVFRTSIKQFRHPEGLERNADGFPLTHYAANQYWFNGNGRRSLKDVSELGTTNVFLVGEMAGNFPAWGYPLNWR